MTRRIMIAVGMVAMMLNVAPAWAHDDYRIIGTVLKISTGKLDVKRVMSWEIPTSYKLGISERAKFGP